MLKQFIVTSYRRGRFCGFTLIELTFAIAIAIVLVLAGLSQYKRYQLNRDLEMVRYNIDLVFQVVNQCVWQNRSDPTDVCSEKNIPNWPPNLFLINNSLTPSVVNYSFTIATISGVTPNSYVINVKVNFPNAPKGERAQTNASLLSWYGSQLNATSSLIGGNTLVWTRTPTYSSPSAETNLWGSLTQLQQFRKMEQK